MQDSCQLSPGAEIRIAREPHWSSMESIRSGFLDDLYAAAVTGDGWKSVLRGYANLVGADAAVLQIVEVKSGNASANVWITYTDDFIDRGAAWFEKDPWVLAVRERLERNPTMIGVPFLFQGAREMPHQKFARSDYYGAFVSEVEIVDSLACSAFHENEYALTLAGHTLGRSMRLFEEDQWQRALQVLPDFQRALSLHVKTVTNGSRSRISTFLSGCPTPAVLVSGNRLLDANAAGRALLDAGVVLRSIRDTVAPVDVALSDALSAIARPGTPRMLSLIQFDATGHRWMVQMVRIRAAASRILQPVLPEDTAIVIFLTPLDMDLPGRERLLEGWSAFTNTEREVAWELLNGATPSEIARTRRNSTATIRWHLDNMMNRTGARNLADLVRLLSLQSPL